MTLCHKHEINCIFACLLTLTDFNKLHGKDNRRKETR